MFELDEKGLWKHRHGLVILPRKSGKTMLMSAAATWALYASGEPGCEVYVVAGSKDQARICYQNIRDVVEADPELSEISEVFKPELSSARLMLSTGAVVNHSGSCAADACATMVANGINPNE